MLKSALGGQDFQKYFMDGRPLNRGVPKYSYKCIKELIIASSKAEQNNCFNQDESKYILVNTSTNKYKSEWY